MIGDDFVGAVPHAGEPVHGAEPEIAVEVGSERAYLVVGQSVLGRISAYHTFVGMIMYETESSGHVYRAVWTVLEGRRSSF